MPPGGAALVLSPPANKKAPTANAVGAFLKCRFFQTIFLCNFSAATTTGQRPQCDRSQWIELFEMIGNEFRHFKHRYLRLAAEDCFELVVRIDHATVCRILQIKFLDIVPHLLGDFGAWQRRCADHCCQHCRWRHGLHEGGIRLAGWRVSCRSLFGSGLGRWRYCWRSLNRFGCCRFGRCWCCYRFGGSRLGCCFCSRLGCRSRFSGCCFLGRCCWSHCWFFGCCHLRASLIKL